MVRKLSMKRKRMSRRMKSKYRMKRTKNIIRKNRSRKVGMVGGGGGCSTGAGGVMVCKNVMMVVDPSSYHVLVRDSMDKLNHKKDFYISNTTTVNVLKLENDFYKVQVKFVESKGPDGKEILSFNDTTHENAKIAIGYIDIQHLYPDIEYSWDDTTKVLKRVALKPPALDDESSVNLAKYDSKVIDRLNLKEILLYLPESDIIKLFQWICMPVNRIVENVRLPETPRTLLQYVLSEKYTYGDKVNTAEARYFELPCWLIEHGANVRADPIQVGHNGAEDGLNKRQSFTHSALYTQINTIFSEELEPSKIIKQKMNIQTNPLGEIMTIPSRSIIFDLDILENFYKSVYLLVLLLSRGAHLSEIVVILSGERKRLQLSDHLHSKLIPFKYSKMTTGSSLTTDKGAYKIAPWLIGMSRAINPDENLYFLFIDSLGTIIQEFKDADDKSVFLSDEDYILYQDDTVKFDKILNDLISLIAPFQSFIQYGIIRSRDAFSREQQVSQLPTPWDNNLRVSCFRIIEKIRGPPLPEVKWLVEGEQGYFVNIDHEDTRIELERRFNNGDEEPFVTDISPITTKDGQPDRKIGNYKYDLTTMTLRHMTEVKMAGKPQNWYGDAQHLWRNIGMAKSCRILLPGWSAHLDPESKKVYFSNGQTGETSWNPPE
jgi:hypothetical protein